MIAIIAVVIVVAAGVGIGITVMNNNKDNGLDENVEISIAYLNLGYYPFTVGFQKGMWDDLGFKVKPVVVSGSGNVAVETLLTGGATIAATGDGPFATTFGKYPNDIVGLCQYSQQSGSLAGHAFFVKNEMSDKLDAMEKKDGITTNAQTTANQIKALSAAKEGKGPNGMFSISVNNGSTTHVNLMKWCIKYGLTYTTLDTETADMYINAIPSATADILMGSLDTYDAVACNSKLHGTIFAKIGDKVYDYSDTSCLSEASYSVVCTTAENYEKYAPYMMKIVENIKKINEWIDQNVDEAAQIVADLNGTKMEDEKATYLKAEHKVIWSDNLNAWVETAKINGYTVTLEQFIRCCPIRDTINNWYK